jgi:hypothetical protein
VRSTQSGNLQQYAMYIGLGNCGGPFIHIVEVKKMLLTTVVFQPLTICASLSPSGHRKRTLRILGVWDFSVDLNFSVSLLHLEEL